MKNKTINESSFSDIDIIAQEAKDFKDFVKEFYKEYKDFPKDRDTIKWLKGVYDNRSTSESVNEANAIGKKIFSDAKGKLFFGYQNDDDSVQFVDYKTWKKLSMKDLSNEFLANRVINSIVRNERQLNKKVEYNMWSKKTNPSFEDRMDYFIKNNWISNITKTGIKESVNESHFQVGDKVKMSHGGVGVVKSLDKEDGGDDEKYYNIELPNGEVMKHAPNELTLVETDLNESTVSIGDIVFFPPANSAATVVDRMGRSVTLKLANGKKVKTIINKVKLLTQDNVNEGVSRDAAYIHGILKSGQDATQNFIDDNGLDGEKLSEYVRVNRNNIDGYNVKHYISGERGTVGSVPKLLQAFIKKFKKGKSNEEVNEDTKRTNILGIDFNISEMNGRIFFSFKDKKAASLKIREIGTNKIVNLIQKSLDNAYGKGEFFFKGGDHAEFQNGYLFQRSISSIKLNKLKFESVNEGNAFTGALFNARKEGLTEFEFNGKMYPVHKLEEEETPIKESKLSKSDLKKIIKEEYHNVKNFMEENYGFTPELGKVYSSLINKSFLKEQEKKNEGNESDSDMAVDQLDTSIRKAQELIAKLRGKGDLEPWVQSLITKAEDYISTVSDYSEVDEYDVENYEDLNEFSKFMNEYTYDINEAEYQGRKVKLGKVMQGDTKKFKVYVKNDKGNVVKVNFGQGGDAKGGTMRIRKDNPEARASFRARHNCDNPGPRYKARYWSCRQW